jgi:choline transport protein
LRKILSYLVGWLCALGWQSYVPGAGNICGSAIQGFAVVANSSYVPKTWQLVLLTIFICSFAILFNIFLARRLPGIEAAVFTTYILCFVAFFIVLLAMGPRSSAKEIFTDFQDNAGWGSIGTACFVGVSGPVITLIGADSSVHMAEELKDAARQLPKAMISTALVNYVLGFLMTIAFIAVLGNLQEVLATPTLLPYVQVIWNATLSRAATMTMVAFIIFFFIFCAVNQNTTSSRQLYAFARDGGLPFSAWVSYVSSLSTPPSMTSHPVHFSIPPPNNTPNPVQVSPTLNIPINAVLISWVIACGLGCIPLGSTAAFLNIQTIGNSGLLVSYIICISCRLHHRNTVGPHGKLLKPPPFFLGKIGGNIINSIAVCFLICFVVSDMFPPAPHPNTETANWSPLAMGGTIVVALICYIKLRKSYLGAGQGNARLELINMNAETETKSFGKEV